MDHHGYLYVSDFIEHEVRRYTIGDENGIVLAGRNGEGNQLNQLNCPTYLLVDEEQAVYLSGEFNYCLMKWNKGAKEGIVIAGERGMVRHSCMILEDSLSIHRVHFMWQIIVIVLLCVHPKYSYKIL